MFPFASLLGFAFGNTFFLHVSNFAGASFVTGNISIRSASSVDRSNVGHGDLPGAVQDDEPSVIRFIHQIILFAKSRGPSNMNLHFNEVKASLEGLAILPYIWYYMTMYIMYSFRFSRWYFHAQEYPWLIQTCWFHKQPCTSITRFRETVVNPPYPPLTFVGSVRNGNFWRACGSCLFCSCSNGSLKGTWSHSGLGMIFAWYWQCWSGGWSS